MPGGMPRAPFFVLGRIPGYPLHFKQTAVMPRGCTIRFKKRCLLASPARGSSQITKAFPCLAGATAVPTLSHLARGRGGTPGATASARVTERASKEYFFTSNRIFLRNKRFAFESYGFELSSMTASMRRTAGVESVETTYSFREQTLRVWELRICIVLRGRRHGGAAHGRLLSQAKVALCAGPLGHSICCS